MIIKGKARSNAKQLGVYLLHNKENEQTRVLEVRSGVTRDVKAALLDMELANELTKRGEKPLYSVEINPAIGEDKNMKLEDWILIADNLEKELGFDDQDRVLVWQEKRGKDGQLRQHVHAVWSRVKDGKLIPISHNYLKHDFAREKSEIALGHKRTLQPKDIKQALTHLWSNSRDGQDFINKAFAKGYKIGKDYDTGKGRTRPYCVVTPDGQKLDFVRQLDKVKTDAVRERFKDIEASLPTGKHLDGQEREREKQNKRRYRTSDMSEKVKFARERKKAKEINQQRIQAQEKANQEQTAKRAGENFADITAKPEPKISQVKEQKPLSEKLNEFKENQKAEKTKQERAKEAGQNFKDVTSPETDIQREIREAIENMRNDDFGLEHELE